MPAQNSEIQIMGVWHSQEYLAEALKKLNELWAQGKIDPQKGIALEISPSILNLFQRVYPTEVGALRQNPEIAEYTRKFIEQTIRTQPKLEKELRRLQPALEAGFTRAGIFWYGIYRTAKTKGIRIHAFESEAVQIRTVIQSARLNQEHIGRREEKSAENFRDILNDPIREKIFAKKIRSIDPSIAITGQVHAFRVQNILRKNNRKAVVVYTTKDRKYDLGNRTEMEGVVRTRKRYADRQKIRRQKQKERGLLKPKARVRFVK
ncbi:MAG: hypothetical protein Q7S92_00955 [Candidatus Diapherotrites archaeon]|nr:hypothetical protein [Candidatus Diapherotrites archaeon]